MAEHSFCALFLMQLSACTRISKTNMRSIERSFYLLNTRTICVIFLHNWTQRIDGFSLLLQRYVRKSNDAKNPAIRQVRYINILTQLRGFQGKLLYLVLFSLYPSLFWELRDKRNLKNLQFWSGSLGAMLEYRYIKRGLFSAFVFIAKEPS